MHIQKRGRLTVIENKLVFTSAEREKGRGNTGVKEWEVQTFGCKIGYKDALYSMGNTANILQ